MKFRNKTEAKFWREVYVAFLLCPRPLVDGKGEAVGAADAADIGVEQYRERKANRSAEVVPIAGDEDEE